MIDPDDVCEIEVEFVKSETAAAYFVVVDGVDFWLAKSQIIGESALNPGDEVVTITVPLWLAEDNGWA